MAEVNVKTIYSRSVDFALALPTRLSSIQIPAAAFHLFEVAVSTFRSTLRNSGVPHVHPLPIDGRTHKAHRRDGCRNSECFPQAHQFFHVASFRGGIISKLP